MNFRLAGASVRGVFGVSPSCFSFFWGVGGVRIEWLYFWCRCCFSGLANLISSFHILQKKTIKYWCIFQLKRHYFGIKLLYIFGRSRRRKKKTSLVEQSNVACVI